MLADRTLQLHRHFGVDPGQTTDSHLRSLRVPRSILFRLRSSLLSPAPCVLIEFLRSFGR